MNDFFNKIQAGIPGFSKGQKLIAKFITESYDKAAFMTANRLGSAIGVSESTVVRFAVKLGYEGYPELQKALQEIIRNKLTSVQRLEVTTDRLGNRDIFQMVLNSDIEKIRLTLSELDEATFNGAVMQLLSAQNIYIIGVRSSAALAGFLSFYFNLMFPNVRVVSTTSDSELFEQILRIGEGDVIIGISFPRYSKRTVKALKYAKSRASKVISITDSMLSPLSLISDFTLIAKSDMASFADSLVAPLSVINALIVAVGMKKKDDISETLEKLESIWDEYGVYEKPENGQ